MNGTRSAIWSRRVLVYLVALHVAIVLLHTGSFVLSTWGPAAPPQKAFALLGAYSAIVLIALLLLSSKGIDTPQTEPWALSWLLQHRVRLTLAAVAGLGLVLHLASKLYFISQSNPSCFMDLRFVWLNRVRDGTPPWVEISSRLGHLLSSAVYPSCLASIYALIARKPGFDLRNTVWALYFFGLGVLYASVMVSRSTLVTLLMLCVAGLVLGLARERLTPAKLGSVLAIVAVTAGVTTLISLARFESNLSCIRDTARSASLAIEQKGFNSILPMRSRIDGTADPRWESSSLASVDTTEARLPKALGRLALSIEHQCATCAMAMTYLNHGVWNLAWVTTTTNRGTLITLAPLYNWLGLESQDDGPDTRAHGAGGLTLPGAAFHDLGIGGVLLLALVLPLLLAAALACMHRGAAMSSFGLVMFVIAFLCLGWAMLFHGWSVMVFPFVVLGMSVPFVGACLRALSRKALSPA